MWNFRRYFIELNSSVNLALSQLNVLAAEPILFIVNSNDHFVGSLTDGDARCGFLKGLVAENKAN